MLVPRWATQSQHWPAVCCLTRHLYGCVCGHPLCVHVFSVHLCCGNVFTHTHTHTPDGQRLLLPWQGHGRLGRSRKNTAGSKRTRTGTNVDRYYCFLFLQHTRCIKKEKTLSQPFAPFVQEFSWVQMNAWATDGADDQQQQLSVWRSAESSAAAGRGGNPQVTSQLVQQRCDMLPPVENAFFFFYERIQTLPVCRFIKLKPCF